MMAAATERVRRAVKYATLEANSQGNRADKDVASAYPVRTSINIKQLRSISRIPLAGCGDLISTRLLVFPARGL
jgi:hypothetical protein